jgi:hypothetical protein
MTFQEGEGANRITHKEMKLLRRYEKDKAR